MDLRVDATVRGDHHVLAPAGDIDLHTAPELRNQLDTQRKDGAVWIVVDLSGVEFLDSSALGMLVGAHHELVAAGGGLKIACPKPHVQKVFRITRLAEVVPIFESVDGACG